MSLTHKNDQIRSTKDLGVYETLVLFELIHYTRKTSTTSSEPQTHAHINTQFWVRGISELAEKLALLP